MDGFEGEHSFAKTTHQTECLETDVLNFKNIRLVKLAQDLGIYVYDKDGTVVGRVDSVPKGNPSSLVMYDTEFNVTSLPWTKVEDRKHPKTGQVTKQLTLNGSIKATDVVTSDDCSIDDKLSRVTENLNEIRTAINNKVDSINASIQMLVSSVSTLTDDLTCVAEKLVSMENRSYEREPYLCVESTDPAEAKKWHFKAMEESDGSPSLQVCYENSTASKFVGPRGGSKQSRPTPSVTQEPRLPKRATVTVPTEAQPKAPTEATTSRTSNEATTRLPNDIQSPTTPSKAVKQKMSVTLKTPSDRRTKSQGSAERGDITTPQVETVTLNRLPRSALG